MSTRTIYFDQLHPVVRFATSITLQHNHPRDFMVATDCRLFLLKKGVGQLNLGSKIYAFDENRLIYLPNGVPYQLVFEKESALSLFIVNFDLTHERSDRPRSIPMEKPTPESLARISQATIADCPALNEPACFPLTTDAFDMLGRLEREYISQKLYADQHMSGCLLTLLCMLARQSVAGSNAVPNYEQPVDQVIAYIQAHFSAPLTNASIGAALNYHPNYINRLMVIHTGQSLHRYLMNVRVRHALDLIQSTGQPLFTIALSCGFKDNAHFSRCFKDIMGESPSAFRLSGLQAKANNLDHKRLP